MWTAGDAYEAYVGRWSRTVAVEFVRWLGMPAGRRWLDVGCGTGALTAAVPDGHVVGVDPSRGFLAGRTDVVVGDARALPFPDDRFDVVVSGLAMNFVPDTAAAVAEQVRVAAPGATVAAYVWDYADGMTMMRHFWDVALELDPAAPDEGRLFPLCRPDGLRAAWEGAGLTGVTVAPVEVPTVFADFDEYWQPFLGGTGAAPAYLVSLPADQQAEIRERLRTRLTDLRLTARAWAVRGMMGG